MVITLNYVRKETYGLLTFSHSGVINPADIKNIKLVDVDTSIPLIISGRGPTWLYAYLAHEYHFAKALAIFDPRYNAGIIIESRDFPIGMMITLDGKIVESEKAGELKVSQYLSRNFNIISVRASDIIKPGVLSDVKLPSINEKLPAILDHLAPMWANVFVTVKYVNMVPWFGVLDRKLGKAVVVARHSDDAPDIGDLIDVNLEQQLRRLVIKLKDRTIEGWGRIFDEGDKVVIEIE